MRYILKTAKLDTSGQYPYMWVIVDTKDRWQPVKATAFSNSGTVSPRYITKRLRILNDLERRQGNE